MEDLCDKWTDLDIGEDDDGEVLRFDDEELENVAVDLSRCLQGRLLRRKTFNRNAFKTVMARIWRPKGKLEISDHDGGGFCFRFELDTDKKRVWDLGPWTFDKSLVVLRDPDLGGEGKDEFRHVEFWIQMHGVPVKYRSATMGEMIGKRLGRVLKVDKDRENRIYDDFIRVRVAIDIGKPLSKGIHIMLGSEKTWVAFKFEKLPDFCYSCGSLGHGIPECSSKVNIACEMGVMKFGAWLRGEAPI